MLKIKTNKNNCKLTYVPININSITTGETDNDEIAIKTNGRHNIKENDEVAFIRQDGESISYFKNAYVKNVVNKNTFTIEGFNKYLVEVNGCKPSFINYADNIFKNNNETKVVTNVNVFSITGNTINESIILRAATEASVTLDSIKSISIGSEVTYISDSSFIACTSLTQINVAENNRNYTSENGVLFNKNKTELICYPTKKNGITYEIPTTVEKIGNNAFRNIKNLSRVTIPSFVEKIGDYAFYSKSTLIILCKPIDPPIISDITFNKATLSLIRVDLNQVKRYKTAWKKIKSKIEGYILQQDTKINQKNTILYLAGSTDFIEITGTTIDSGMTMQYTSLLTSVIIGTDVKTIGYSAFNNCRLLSSVTIPETVIKIEDRAFTRCVNLLSIVIPDSVVTIGDYAFAECGRLSNIFLGKNVKYIGKHAFYHIYDTNTDQTANIYCDSTEPPVLGDSDVFRTRNMMNPQFYVNSEVLNTYKGVYMSPNNLTMLNQATSEKYVCLNTNEHIFTINTDDIKIRRKYLWDANSESYRYEGALTMCDGDYYIFDNLFLVKNVNNEDVSLDNLKLDITATTAGFEPVLLTNCLIGVNFDGDYDRYHIYIPFDGNDDFISKIEDRLPNTTFTADDIRFLYNGDNQMKFGQYLQPGTHIDKICGNIEIDFNVGDNFEVNLHNEEQVNNFIENVKNDSVNKIIDYERRQYVPMYYTKKIPEENDVDSYFMKNANGIDSNLKEVKKIEFNLFFRVKDYTLYDYEGNEIDKQTGDTSKTDYVDFGTWETKDDDYWNNLKLRSDHKALEYRYQDSNIYADLLGYLGFTDDDVYYQKDALKESFLRLSFYDSPNRETQKLLYYSTIYFDTNDLNRRYIKDLNSWRDDPNFKPTYNQLVFSHDIVKSFMSLGTSALTAELTCTDKYSDTNSSDGFYIHLFDKLVSGDTCTPIYIKAEFNNAKFGKTVPMIRPIFKKTNNPISPTNESFPREYIKSSTKEGNVYTWTDMDMLLRDMYIKIFIKFDFKTNQYVWFVPQTSQLSDTLTFNLYEPRINGYDYAAYETLNGDNTKYGTEDGKPNWFESEFNENHEWINVDGETETEWASNFNGCLLMTTATTLDGENMLNGTKLFNDSVLNKIERIWIDGMEIKTRNVYDESKNEYTTTYFQLPDIPFDAITTTGEEFTWEPETTKECWDDETQEWREESIKPKIIHKVNYYFKATNSDVTELFDELYLGIYNEKQRKRLLKTIETTQDISNRLKVGINLTNGYKLPNGMFANIKSLRCLRTVKHKNNYLFTTIGNGAFNNCQSLVKINIDAGSIDIIGKNCFSGCRSLKTADLPSVKIILREAFQGCHTLSIVNFGTGNNAKIKYIGCGSFGYTKIRFLTIPSSVIRIGNSAYRRCYQLESFSFGSPSNLETLGKRVFADCAALKYNLKYNGAKKLTYTYYGGIPNILLALCDTGANIQFYDARSEKYKTLEFSTEKDRGKVQYHYKDDNYRSYSEKEGPYVLNFGEWFRKIF